MGEVVDESIVRLSFDNKAFEQGIQQSINSVNELNSTVNREMGRVSESFNPLLSSINLLTRGMSTGGIIVASAFNRLTNDVISSVNKMINSALVPMKTMMTNLTTIPMKTGMQEYELKMKSIQVMMASTGESIDKINGYLDELNTYSDRTIYSFADMTNNIGKFTNAGVKLDVAVEAMRGLMNEAALAGATTAEASRAMYNLAQSLSMGYVQYIDWKSIENANMATIDFKKNLANTAVEVGKLKKVSEGLYSTGKKTYTIQQLFKDGLKDQWLSTEALTTTLRKYQDESENADEQTKELAKKAYAAAQDMKTFTQMMDTIKEALQSGWSMTWQKLFGNLIQAKQLWTSIGVSLNDFIGKIDDYRNKILALANIRGFRDNLITIVLEAMDEASKIFYQFRAAFDDVFGNIFEETNSMGFLVRNLTRFSEVLKDIHNKLKLNDQTIKALRISFRAFFSVCELVWRAFDETGRAISQMLTGTEDLTQGLARVATLISIVILGMVDWIKESGKITSTINFIKEKAVELSLGIVSIFGSIGKVFNMENLSKIFDQVKKFFSNMKNYIFDFDFGTIDFSGLLDSFDGLMDKIGSVELNMDGFVQFLMSLGTIIIQAYQIVFSPLTSLVQVMTRFGNAIASIFERMSPREFTRLVKIIVAAAKGIVSLSMRLDYKRFKQAKWINLFDGLTNFTNKFAVFYMGIGNFMNRLAFTELAGKIAEVTRNFALIVKGIADIIINLAWLIGVATLSSFVIKQFGLLPQLIAIVTMVGALFLAITAVFLTIGTHSIQAEQMEPFIKAMEMIIFQILALAASSALMGTVENSIAKLLSITACVSILTFIAGYIARELNNTVLTSGRSSVNQKLKMIGAMVALISGMSLVLAATTKIVDSNYNMSKLYLLEGAITLMSGIIIALQVVMNKLESSGFVSSSWTTFGPLLGQITSLFAELIVSINFMVDISNKLESVGSLWNVVWASEVFTLLSVILYNTLAPMVPMDWGKAASIFGQMAILIAETVAGLSVLTNISNEIKDVGKFWTAILGLIALLGGLELLSLGVIGLGKVLAGIDIIGILGAIGMLGALVIEMSLIGEALGRISTMVDDPRKFIEISATITAMFTALEVLTLGAMGIGALMAAFPMIAGAGVLIGALSLLAFVQLIVIIVAEFELFRESMPDQNALLTFLDGISRFMLNLAAVTIAGVAAGAGAIVFLPYLIPLALLPVGLGIIFLQLCDLYEKYKDKLQGMTMFLVALPTFFNNIEGTVDLLSSIGGKAKSSLTGALSLIPMIAMMSLLFGELLWMTNIFPEKSMGKITNISSAVASAIKPLMSVFMLLSDFSANGKASLKGMAMFMALLPILGVISNELGRISKDLQANKEEIMDTFDVLADIFSKINDDIYYGMTRTINVLKQLSKTDMAGLIKTTLGVSIINFVKNIGTLPFQKDKSIVNDLVEFGEGLSKFAESISGITDFDSITLAIQQIANIAAATNRINNTEGTLIAKFFGDNSIGKLGTGLSDFGTKLKELDEVVKGVNLDKNSPVDKVVDYIKRLGRSRITNTAGTIRGWLFGDNSLATFGKELEAFGISFKQFALSVMSYKKTTYGAIDGSITDPMNTLGIQTEDMLYDFDMIDKVIQRITDLKFATTGIWNVGGLLGLLFGNNSLGKFGEELAKFGEEFGKFSENIKTIDWDALDDFDTEKVNELIDWAATATENISPIVKTIVGIVADAIILLIRTVKETLTPGFVQDIIDIISSITDGISGIIESAKDPLENFFNFLTITLPHIVKLLSSTVGNVDWLNAVADCVERICKSIQDLTTKAIIPLIQNGIIPLVAEINKANPIYLLTKIVELSNNVVKAIMLGIGLLVGAIGGLVTFIGNIIGAGITHMLSKINMFWVMLEFQFELAKLSIQDGINWIIEQVNGIFDDIKSGKIVEDIEKICKKLALTITEKFIDIVTGKIQDLYDTLYALYDLYSQVSGQINSEEGPSGGGGGGPSSSKQPSAYGKPGPKSYNGDDLWLGDDLVPNDETIDEAAKETKEKFIGSFENSPASTHAGKNDELKDQLKRHYEYEFDTSPAATHGKKYSGGTYWRAYNTESSTSKNNAKVGDWQKDDLYLWAKNKINDAKFLSEESKKTIMGYLNEYYPKAVDMFGAVDSVTSFYNTFVDTLSGAGKTAEEAAEALGLNNQAAEDSAEKNNLIKEKQLLSESAYWAQLLEIKKQGVDGVKYQDMSLADFEEETLNTINSLYDSYLNEFNSKMSNFAGGNIFSKVDWGFDAENPFTKNNLFGNLQDQIDQLDRYSNVMMSLNDRIDNEGLRKAINDMGVDSIEELETLNSLTEAELDNYEAMYVSKMESATRAATVATQNTYDQTMAEIANIIGMPDVSPEMIEQWFDGTLTSLDKMMSSMSQDFGKVGENITTGITEGMTNDAAKLAVDNANEEVKDDVLYGTEEEFEEQSPSKLMEREVGVNITAGIAKGMTNSTAMNHIKASVALVVAWYKSEFNEKIGDFEKIGENLMKGLERGIRAGSLAASYATGISADEITNVYVRKFGIHSPSTVFEEFGNYLMEGLSIGVKNGTSNAEKTMEQSANSTLGIMQSAVERAYAAMNSESVPAITPVVNMNKLQNGLRTMDTALAAQRSYLMANAANASIDTSVHKEVSINNQAAVDAITRLNGDILNLGDRLANMQIMLDTGIVAGQMAPAMDSELGTLMMRSMREGAG